MKLREGSAIIQLGSPLVIVLPLAKYLRIDRVRYYYYMLYI